MTVALAGNPNSGKTTIFNALTGGRAHVGNYPGVTVELKAGWTRRGDKSIQLVDLPGTYSLTAYSAEEVVARNFILDEKPDVVIDILDCSNLERNLYLAVQMMELGAPLVLAFNMSDLAEAAGQKIDVEMLSGLLGVPIVPTVAHKGQGIEQLMAAAAAVAADPDQAVGRQRLPTYGRELEPEVARLAAMVPDRCRQAGRDRWVAVKLLEDDTEAVNRLHPLMPAAELAELLGAAEQSRRHIHSVCGDAAEIILADRRYGFISGACQETVRTTVESRHALSDRIDAVVTNRFLGLPLFLILTLLVFQVTFWLGRPLSGYLEKGKDLLAGQVWQLWPRGSDSLLGSLLADGLIKGVGAVLVFVPIIFLLFLAIALLEDSGYMARAAFVMDRLMHKIGLHGRSFIPMLIGFGCSVPGILATRTLESRRDRLTTMLVLPLFSCGARLPVYVLIIAAFFPRRTLFSLFGVADVTNQALLLMSMYLIGIALALAAAKLLRSTLFRGEVSSFVMELPPYRLPTLRGALIHTWERGWMFLRKAGTVILGAVIVLWALTSFPRPPTDPADQATRDQADRQYLAAAAKIDREAGLSGRGSAFAEARLQLAQARRRHWPDSQAFGAARLDYERRVRGLAQDSDRFARFLAAFEAAGTDDVEEGFGAAGLRPAAGAMLEAEGRRREQLQDMESGRARRKLEYSVMGRMGKAVEPAMRPCGFDWKISTALLAALSAKEVFVGQMGVIYALGRVEDDTGELEQRLQRDYTPLQGFCIMLFCLISLPCIPTLVATWRESGSVKWALGQLVGLTLLAWGVTAVVYQVGRALGLGTGLPA